MLEGQRPFNPEALAPYAVPDIRPPLGIGALVWRYTILLPITELRSGGQAQALATLSDLETLGEVCCDHFGGVTAHPLVSGYGLRDPADPTSLEFNQHLPFAVYARPVAASDRYFERLQQELQEALVQGLIVVEREEVFLIGSSRPAPTPRQLPAKDTPSLPAPNP
ncbi:MAG: hypothetical protein L0Z62_29630 [Gemmataceae bacterium]|nr:hypothetical protein [Gemmataceae bacterium]